MSLKENDFKIFILSESVTYRNNLAAKLRIEGFSVEFASGGFHFLHLLERQRNGIDMLICHENMNDMPADEIISISRLSRTKLEMPILFLSKDNDEEIVCEMIMIGANDFILQSNNMLPVVERVRKHYSVLKTAKAS